MSGQVVFYMLVVLIAALLIFVIRKKLKLILAFLVSGFISVMLMLVVNNFAPFGVTVGVNPVTALTAMILGFPGIICLYVVAGFL
jgi:inhibitor of the pro-sigma K processing machinery